MKKTALIILNYNNSEDTINCIESVENYNSAPIKYIVVDNGSTRDSAVETLNNYFTSHFSNRYCCYDYEDNVKLDTLPYLTFVVSHTNDGYACGNNKGLQFAYADDECEQIMILNNDILFVEDIIPQLLDFQKTTDDAAIVSPVLYKKGLIEYDFNCARLCHSNWEIILTFLFMSKNVFGLIAKWTNQRYLLKSEVKDKVNILQVELPSGSCMLISKSLMKEIDGFDPNTFLYYEENILFQKIKKMNRRNYVICNCKCIHLGASSTKKTSHYFTLNALVNSASYYLKKYTDMTTLQSSVWSVAYRLFQIKLFVLRLIKR